MEKKFLHVCLSVCMYLYFVVIININSSNSIQHQQQQWRITLRKCENEKFQMSVRVCVIYCEEI